MNRSRLITAAAIVFAWLTVATVLWLRDAGSLSRALAHLWTAARADWMVVAILTDALVFVLLALLWLWRDAWGRGWSRPRRLAWIAATVAFGSPALLLYLALSQRQGRAAEVVDTGRSHGMAGRQM
jgi:hypothetical protein